MLEFRLLPSVWIGDLPKKAIDNGGDDRSLFCFHISPSRILWDNIYEPYPDLDIILYADLEGQSRAFNEGTGFIWVSLMF